MNKVLFACLFLWMGVSLSSCYKDNEEELYPVVSTCDTASVTYSGQVAAILQTSCLACHSNSSAPISGGGIALEGHANLSSYISNNSTRFIGSIEHTSGYSTMPKGGNKMDDCKISQIKKWMNDGAQNN